MIDPETASAASAPAPEAQDNDQDNDNDNDAQDTGAGGPLERIEAEPAEDGGVIVSHHPKASKRVKNADFESMKPKKHVFSNKKKAAAHIAKHLHRLRA